MADDKRSTTGGSPRRRRPAPTIDLTAREVPPAADARVAEPEIVQPAAEAAPSSPSSVLNYVAFGAALGVVIIGGFAVLWLAGVLPARDSGAGRLDSRLAALETQLRQIAERKPAPADTGATDDLARRLDKIEQAVSKPPPPPQPDAALLNRLTTIESGLTALTGRADQAGAIDALGKRLEGIEQSTRTTQDKVAANTNADVAARRTLAAFALRDAVIRGAPYSRELAAMKSLDADAATLAALEPFAAAGVPADAMLARELAALLPKLIEAAGADPAQAGGFLDRLEAHAGELVRVRPVGEPAGSNPAAVLARIEVKLARNDVAGADRELAALPPKARDIAAPWRQRVAARDAALEAGRRLVAASAAALGGQ